MVTINVALDESGNFGTDGDYIVVGGIQYSSKKAIDNFIKRQELRFKNLYPKSFNRDEIKHTNAYPPMRYYYVEKILEKSDKIHYCVTNKNKIDKGMLDDENILYNYMVYRIVKRVIDKNTNIKKLNIFLDNRTVKITRRDGLIDYIKGKVYFDLRRPDIEIKIQMFDSKQSRVIQAADFIAGSIYHFYTHNNNICYNLVRKKLDCCYRYPYNNFY